ncbi:DUF4190 domain-containing protein [Alicyclobacillus sp. SO9]|uniref:DUF4190 domain-containing protein n=1 Tax=Alicyclobacillus sp. SO9 TaxID=2665646 RepID=UPI0018E717DB|nr:DUF4190 domain-containing protein [Alicyclobacillus sp. SO9]QQE79348.1 DUF4190 domain-containing protein [Alicyclobacillus sp. SO9]
MTEERDDGQPTVYDDTGTASSQTPERDRSGMAITGLILGIASIMLALIPIIGLISGILGIIFGSLGLRSTRRKSAGWGLGLGIAGVVLSFIAFVIEIASIVAGLPSIHG